MAIRWTELRFLFHRSAGLVRRGIASLRTRGLRASWARVQKHLRRTPVATLRTLYVPDAAPFAPFSLAALRGDPARAPRVSIVIPVYNQFAHTLACLRALAAHPSRACCEIIVVDDGSSDETEASLPRIDGLRYHRRAQNGGFIAACNDGAALAQGDTLVFLNNDTVPQPGWLDALLRTFEEYPNCGLAGAQLIYPDGRLQEAGGLVFADGNAGNYGRFESPDDPRYAFVREADYCSGAAIAIPRELFARLGGFDTRYAPAYYEDTDLALSVRAAGHSVLYQPASRVVHMEGVTAGTDTGSGTKAYQVRNRGVFREKWRDVLASYPTPDLAPDIAAIRARRRTVLVVDESTPRPDRDSGSLRLVNLFRLLREEGAHVVFLPSDRAYDAGYTEALQQLGVEVWHAPFADGAPAWLRRNGRRFDTVVVCRHFIAREFLPALRQHAPQARIVFDSIDLHYLRERRGAELAGDAALLRTAERTRELELDVIARSDVTLVVSETERELLARDAAGAKVEVLSNLHRVAGPGRAFAQRSDLVFVGGFRHPPNVDAVRWFAGAVFPLVRQRLPEVRFHCIGGDVPEEIAALATLDGVAVHGHVTDISPYMDGARVAVAPLRYGAGVKGKVNLSMAHGQPVVATACAVEGMHLRAGEDVLVADDAAGFADAVIRAYGDEALWQKLSANGLRNVERHFSLDAARDVVRRVLLA